ncbi:MAG: exopolysaccharide biosynthesis protein [Cyanobacterium sp. T60_A2020_053]|nr:exopolysaccharide biosynthesis protein [Cyanobacterium sp. T60_A2020_053]
MAKLSVKLDNYLFATERQEKITFDDLMTLAGESIFGFLLAVLSFPSALPIPAPGYSIPFGILIFLLGMQLATGAKTPWLPKRLKKGAMKKTMAQNFFKKGLPWLQKIENITKPRLTYICNTPLGKVFLGVIIALMGISMMIPIPGTNTAPAMGVFIIGFGLQEDDGLICLAGFIVALIAGILSASIIIGAIWGSTNLLEMIR